uniref:Uncharacterized protein n=1 Tax=Siphoviridae sp. cty1O100 TaxID=2825743 RepID=A0A8S5Q458_9CAUD|nr:MAG TPA: hypothetical protein [Siphoviridae sp. cty1O100]
MDVLIFYCSTAKVETLFENSKHLILKFKIEFKKKKKSEQNV